MSKKPVSESTGLLASSSAAEEEQQQYGSPLQRYVFGMVEGDIDSWFEYTILVVIFLNVFSFIIGTLVVEGYGPDGSPPLSEDEVVRLDEKYSVYFELFEFLSVILFTIEYVLRGWSCVADPQFGVKGPLKGRIAYLTSFFCVIDLLAILPYWLNMLGYIGEVDFSTAIRIFRLVRLLKADKYINAFSLLDDVLAENSALLIATMYYALLTLVVSATLLYMTERFNPEVAKYFVSIPDSLWITTIMLTGESPLTDFTLPGRFISAFIAVVAVAIFAVPTAVLGSGFIKAVERAKGMQFSVDAE